MTYNQILREIDATINKVAFIPAPTGGQPGQDPSQGQAGQTLDAAGSPEAQQQQQPPMDPTQSGPPPMGEPPQNGDPSQGGQAQDPSQQPPPGGDLTPQGQPQSLKNTAVTLSVSELLDLVSGGKASQAHLKTESMKVQHGFKHKKMLRDEQRKEQEEQQKQQQEQAMQAQQQQGMMGGGIYSGGPMDGSQPGQASPTPQQPPQPGM